MKMPKTRCVDFQNKFVQDLPDHYAERMWKIRVSSQNGRAKKLAIEGTLTYEGVIKVLEDHEYKCALCKSLEFISLDHKIALTKGGLNVDSNIQPLCRMCNTIKSNRQSV